MFAADWISKILRDKITDRKFDSIKKIYEHALIKKTVTVPDQNEK